MRSLNDKIRGSLVIFPEHFLKEENLAMFIISDLWEKSGIPLADEDDEPPSDEEVLKKLGIPLKTLREAKEYCH